MFPDVRSPKYLPVRTVVKWYDNHQEHRSERNRLISKSLLKTMLIDEQWLAKNADKQKPQDKEFWLVDVVHETCAGQPRGAFLAHPIRPVQFEKVAKLMPGMYEEKWYGDGEKKLLMLEPKTGGVPWMLPWLHRIRIKDAYAVIVSQ